MSFYRGSMSFYDRSNRKARERKEVRCGVHDFWHYEDVRCPICEAEEAGMKYCREHYKAFRAEFKQCYQCYLEEKGVMK